MNMIGCNDKIKIRLEWFFAPKSGCLRRFQGPPFQLLSFFVNGIIYRVRPQSKIMLKPDLAFDLFKQFWFVGHIITLIQDRKSINLNSSTVIQSEGFCIFIRICRFIER